MAAHCAETLTVVILALAELLLLILDEPADHLPPQRLAQVGRHSLLGGTRTDGAIAVGCPAGLQGDAHAYTLHFLAHELFHDWLGGQLQSTEGERLAWFWEGFTEYASLWQLAQQGAVSRAWFAQRVLDWEADLAGNENWGELAFADPDVDWRDGVIEPLAYKGSALLAFELDVTLREAPALYELADTTRVVLVHMERQIRGFAEPFDIGICGHTHKPRTWHDESGRLWVNPGETSGWTYGNPTVALLDTATRTAEILPLGGSREEG